MSDATDIEREGQNEIDASKAPLMDHLVELRQRLIYALIAFFIMFVVCFAFAGTIFNVLLWPFISVVGAENAKTIYTHLLEKFFTEVKLGLFGAAFLSFPFAAIQVYKFVAPGLYRNEQNAFRPYLVATPVLFFIGACVVYFIAMPLLVRFSVGFEQIGGEGQAAIELLLTITSSLAERLGGVLCDDRRMRLSTQGIEHLRSEVSEFERKRRLEALRRQQA